jgi:hypothetical protein
VTKYFASSTALPAGVNPDEVKDHYLKKVLALQRAGLIPAIGAAQIHARHDAWCAIFSGGFCDCDPIVEVLYTARERGT